MLFGKCVVNVSGVMYGFSGMCCVVVFGLVVSVCSVVVRVLRLVVC